MPNRLARETSPYLLQHANNPVDWYPWGAEALDRAKRENKPILLSIGYAACHWCHVMEHESFEDDATAALMNERFVSIKVDREERPDVDAIYMQAVQSMTGHGGWPMTMFLTPDGVPFFGGTYFPNEDRHGMPSFRRVLTAVSDAYQSRPGDVARTAASVMEMYATGSEETRSAGPLSGELLDRAYRVMVERYDETNGGFEGAPKFPQTMSLDFLLRYWARNGERAGRALEMASHSFIRMARGGIFDQIGGGFARYTVDATWLTPHFEKMLYDNALLVRFGAHLWQATKNDEVRRVVEETIEWLAREMTSPEGGFYSSLDADSEGHEGKFYLWTPSEIEAVLGADARVASAYWGVTEAGNFEGANILSVPAEPSVVATRLGISTDELRDTVARARTGLCEARTARVRPGLDDKILAGWNALMLRGVAEAARAFGDSRYAALALRNAQFLFSNMVRDGRVFRSYKGGTPKLAGYLEDHAGLGLAAIAMYELTFDAQWRDWAHTLNETMVTWFWDDRTGAFYDTAADHEQLITRPREITDNAIPSGTSLAVELLTRIAELGHDVDARRRATYVLETLAPMMTRYPTGFGHLLGVADTHVNGAIEVAIVGDQASTDFRALERVVATHYLPSLVLAGGDPADSSRIALLEGRTVREGDRATAYVCRNYACDEPATNPDQLTAQLDALVPGAHV
jgi:uncharacterized protein YyaL (SSP411 family)